MTNRRSRSVVEPPSAMIDWFLFGAEVRRFWPTQYAMNKQMGFKGGSTRNNAWHGKQIGLAPFLRVCKAVGKDPLSFFVER